MFMVNFFKSLPEENRGKEIQFLFVEMFWSLRFSLFNKTMKKTPGYFMLVWNVQLMMLSWPGSVLLQLIQRLGSRHWCAVPLLFLSQALSCLSPCPLLGSDGLHAFRYKLLAAGIQWYCHWRNVVSVKDKLKGEVLIYCKAYIILKYLVFCIIITSK